MTRTYKYTINPDNLVVRDVPIVWHSDAEREEAVRILAELPFVQTVSFSPERAALCVEYDAGHEDIESIESLLTDHGGELLGGWRRRVLDAWHQFQDHSRAISAEPTKEPSHTLQQGQRSRRIRKHRP